jgi:hypothetical protein
MKAVTGSIEKLVNHVIARSNQARGKQSVSYLEDTSPREQGWFIKKGEQHSQQHEHILKPVVYASNLNV